MFLSRATFISAAIVLGVVTQVQAQCPPSNDNGQCKFFYNCMYVIYIMSVNNSH